MHFRPRVCVDCLRVSFGWIACKWLFCLCKIAWKNMMEFGRGGACVPARVAPQGRIHRSSPRTMRDTQTYFWYGNAAAQTFGRAHRHRPYVFRLRELRADVRPYAFRLGGLRMEWLMSFGWIVRKWLFCLCGIAWQNMVEIGRGGAYVPTRVAQ